MNGRQRLVAITEEERIAVDRPRHAHSDLVVKVRRRQDFEIVFEPLHAAHVREDRPQVALLVGLSDMAGNHERVPLRAQLDVVEDPVMGIHHDLVPCPFEHLSGCDVHSIHDDVVHHAPNALHFARRALGIELRPQVRHSARERRHAVVVAHLDLASVERLRVINLVLDFGLNLCVLRLARGKGRARHEQP